MTTICNNLQEVQTRIALACAGAQRRAGSVTLLAVSKTWGPEAVREAFAAGQTRFAENYVQEGVDKVVALQDLPLEWHCIGPIQSNKSRLVAEHFDWVHSVDRIKIAQRLNDQRPAHLPPLQVCLQVNIDGGSTKAGIGAQDVGPLVEALLEMPRLHLRGLMAIPEPAASFEGQLAVHLQMKELFDRLRSTAAAGRAQFDTLSLGMSADLEAAIAAGSTMVRVGTAIFGGRAVHKTPAAAL